MAVVAQSSDVVKAAPGQMLADETWLAARIADLNASWRTDSMRVGATLWWCMTASALVEPVVRALVRDTPIAPPALNRLELSLRPDGTVEKVRILDADADADALRSKHRRTAGTRTPRNRAAGDDRPAAGNSDGPDSGRSTATVHAAQPCGTAGQTRVCDQVSPEFGDVPGALRATLATVIDRLAAVSGVRAPALWAVVTDVVASWAVDARAPEIGQRLAAELGPALPAPRFVDIAGRTFVRRASCCLVYEAPRCEKCVSCPKRPPAERAALLADYTRHS
ncbi:(2Fe-2S)-binding protein [Nocardia carnea]|uniref:(2Fe-2S)-binding protein n=1 Tax=Nocardia carnea TaxID=37328 RepID=A0ABW7TFI3_9NOCA|nr:(2Fe-2S)-binding protein [Nocardia carnea]